jgi:hypothetical protein
LLQQCGNTRHVRRRGRCPLEWCLKSSRHRKR